MAAGEEITKDKLLLPPISPATSQQQVNSNVMTLVPTVEYNKGRRRSTIHSYTLTNYHSLSHDPETMKTVKEMSEAKALKNVIVLGCSFMVTFTAFISLQGLQSSINGKGGVGVASLCGIYAGTILSCLIAPWVIQKLTAKWTMVIGFALFTGYFAGNFYPHHYLLIPLGVVFGLSAGPLWSAQASSITTIALAYAEHSHLPDQDAIINKFMGIFCGLYRCSNIWGNLITALVLNKNDTRISDIWYKDNSLNRTDNVTCGSSYCHFENDLDLSDGADEHITYIPDDTRVMLFSIYLGCGIMGVVILVSLFDHHKRRRRSRIFNDDTWTSKDLFLGTVRMLKDSRCQLLVLMVILIGLEQGFMFSDFTKAYIACTLGVTSIGPIMICFGTVSAVSCIMIGCFASRHIKRFAFITAGATFNAGLLIVLWLWKPKPSDIPNFFVVAGCLGLCDAIWQTQTYTLFGVLFIDKQEAAFASYRMFYATGCAVAFGYSYFLCVQMKVYILGGTLIIALILYCVIEMKVQLQSQHIKDIVAL
ncbi:hypothetical protein FSP39_011897 [Pinctada imbricata]|uniref:Uncharacterized protein n=1 Tax=Pinctada imbricata TaxID=66713 RepID=A0AA88XFD2_PINIB|nr:hypothetical protein FSP39_011897 [Pinctada imbricata]